MKTKLLLLGVMVLAVFFIACPLPQFGNGPSRSAEDGGGQNPPEGTSSVSVVNDLERNQAVYINESGVRIDVVAEEYPGGPLVKCVAVADYTVLPPSTDPDAPPVKVLVAGTRDDGTPGVWQINANDSIELPQPEQTEDNTARAIVGGDMASLPEGIQTRHGWSFGIIGMDGRIIVGEAWSSHDVTIGGVQIVAGTHIGIYWRMYTLPYTRFYIISAPRIIGTFLPQTLPVRWRTIGHHFSDLLLQLKLYLNGTLSSYLTLPTAVSLVGSKATGTDIVTGRDEFGLPAIARINSSGVVTSIEETLPDLAFGAWGGVPTTDQMLDSVLTVNAPLTNSGQYAVNGVTLDYYLSTSDTFSSTDSTDVRKQIGSTHSVAALAIGATAAGTSSGAFSVGGLGFTQTANTTRTYYLYAVADADPTQNFNLTNLGAMAPAASFNVFKPGVVVTDVVTLSVTPGTTLADASGVWSLDVAVALNGSPTTSGTLDVTVSKDGTTVESGTVPITSSISGTLTEGGTYSVSVTAHAGTASATTLEPNKILAMYPRIVIETYDPLGFGTGWSAMDVYNATDMGLGSLIASDPIGANGSMNPGFAYIDLMSGLYPGNYYAKVYASPDGIGFPQAYAIRVLTAPTDYPGWTGTAADGSTWETNTPATAPTVNLGSFLPDRYYLADDVDWVKIHLP